MTYEVRTRFAPSPTGYMHIGNLRTALYSYLLAKKNNGKFILRIEDTDQERYVEGAIDVIFRSLKLAGLRYDEGPDIGGCYGPYIQSQRKAIYMEHAKILIDKESAYYCFCNKERLSKLKEEQEALGTTFNYDRYCRNLSKDEITEKLKEGQSFVIRQKMPLTGTTTFNDAVYGMITVSNEELDDQILIKSDGFPTYNFANVVDDHLMKITHVVRGNEYLSSTPKYNLLYESFGWDIPVYVHLPLILRPTGQKLSKRAGDPSFEDLISNGYLPEAVVNYVALLGWSPGTTQEIFTLEELEQCFTIEGISKAPAVFDIKKLNWMNGEYIRKMPLEEFNRLAIPYYKKVISKENIDFMKISKLLQVRTEVLSTIPESIDFIERLPEYDASLYINKKMKTDIDMSLSSLKAALPILENLQNWDETGLHDSLIKLANEMGIKSGQMFWPIRVAITGKEVTPGGAVEIASILGKDETIKRIKFGIEKLLKEEQFK